MKERYEVTKESYSIYYHKGIKRLDAEKLCKSFYANGCNDAKTLGTFETLAQATAFAEATAQKEDLRIYDKQAQKAQYYLDFTLIRVSECCYNENDALISCDGWKDYGATFDELVDAMCSPQSDEDEDDD